MPPAAVTADVTRRKRLRRNAVERQGHTEPPDDGQSRDSPQEPRHDHTARTIIPTKDLLGGLIVLTGVEELQQ